MRAAFCVRARLQHCLPGQRVYHICCISAACSSVQAHSSAHVLHLAFVGPNCAAGTFVRSAGMGMDGWLPPLDATVFGSHGALLLLRCLRISLTLFCAVLFWGCKLRQSCAGIAAGRRLTCTAVLVTCMCCAVVMSLWRCHLSALGHYVFPLGLLYPFCAKIGVQAHVYFD
ncbi:hypothetical protein COO60DRAFT_489862 [Scenedesmus sp. NREL 46B-D3]|nr:hypothetical protein COO60DRAFT_489862 [Scenedesmus sp. NREL 46B-D3]